jgi:hypothetical protein
VQGQLGLGQLEHVLRLGVLAEEQLQQAEAAELGRLVGRLGQPGFERVPASLGDPVAAPPPAGLLTLLGQQPKAGQALGLGVDLAVRELPEVGHAAAHGRLEGVRGGRAVPGHQAEDDVGHGGEAGSRHAPGHIIRSVPSDSDYRSGANEGAGHGGSSGRRGIFAFGWREWAEAYAGFIRPSFWDLAVSPELAGVPVKMAMIGARNATHMTSAMPQTFANPAADVVRLPVSQPIDQIVAGLNAYQPLVLMGYPSMLNLLAAEAGAGRLRILPWRITITSEPLLPEVRRALAESFGAPVANMYGTSEAGPMGAGCWRSPGIHLCDDLVIVEPVDTLGRPVPPGTRSDKVLVTTISNPTLPLIRFELTDQVTVLDTPCRCGSAHTLIADVEGRLDDAFTYPGGRVVHPHVFRSVLGRDRRVVEYQVRQTPSGAEVLVVGAPADPAATGRRFRPLEAVGVSRPA